MVVGSDAHLLGIIVRAYAEIEIDKSMEEIDSEDIIKALKSGNVEMRGRGAPIYRAVYHYVKASIRRTMYYSSKFLEELNPKLKRYNRPLREMINSSPV